ncbi:DHA2 family efflux MFS transporter permease subunit [Hyphomonas sp. WL0036]|uniref:DHA2 family efflux MFS transporter permease subunit n=1 Tax=Hyphomonas sediminis TaxID=2866160 RepID=UPI001C7F8240|nr:DHA2 family efflux MFS transporter permease subunit [Hyphomonas sediminis]MBY9065277.1 DHA2 family efflux MFS transporter permease subunit [Hyphomonas sediminis]
MTAATATPGAGAPAGAGAAHEKVPLTLHIGFLAMVIGMFMSILDVQIVASSIRQIQAGVAASGEEIAWVQTGYLIAEVVGIPLSGFLNRVFGIRRLFIISAGAFTVSSFLCALSWDLDSLVAFRAIQGFVGAAMVPTTMAAAFTLFPGGRSMTQQVMIGMVATLAPSIGPTLGGWVTEHLGWHWLFLINIVPGIAACVLVYLFVPKQKGDLNLLKRLDVLGFSAMALFLGSLEWVVDEGPAAGWFSDGDIRIATALCIISAAIFFYRAFSYHTPVVDLKVFGNRNFWSGSLLATIVGFGLYGSVYILPLFLGQVRGFSSLQIGHIMSISGLAMFIGGPLAGALTRRLDPRIVVGIGIALVMTGLWGNAQLTPQSGFDELFWPQALRGMGLILTMVPVSNLALGTLPPPQVANASGLFTVVRNLGGAIGIAALNTMTYHFTALHEQELGSRLDPSRPEVQAFLQQAEANAAAHGLADPSSTAIAQLVMRMKLEALTMTFNNLFMAMAMAFCFISLTLLVLKKPINAPGGPAH